jgi:hypothetical protein
MENESLEEKRRGAGGKEEGKDGRDLSLKLILIAETLVVHDERFNIICWYPYTIQLYCSTVAYSTVVNTG